LLKKFPAARNKMQHITQRLLLPIIWIVAPVTLLILWCIALNATNIMVALFIILCTNDTMAYVFGSLFGKHKLWPRVSPKKSWEGFFGGLICTMAATWAFIHIPYFQNDTFTNPYLWMGFAFVVIIAGTFGDFAESMVKRFAQQKDSGSILPGHGGVLDRIDSMLFAVPAGFLYWGIVELFKV
jgi:phosphatidate cytidylyltransferase